MNKALRAAGLLALALAILVGMSAVTVSAQGPTGAQTPSPTPVTGTTPTPAQAPPQVGAGANLDTPVNAPAIGSVSGLNIPANSAQWFSFQYDNNNNQFPRPQVAIRMLNTADRNVGFEVWSPERLAEQPWWERASDPVGRGTRFFKPNCTTDCLTNDLFWQGGFGLSGTYHVRVINNTDQALTPRIVVSGPGIAQCRNANQGVLQEQAAQQGIVDLGTIEGFRMSCLLNSPVPALSPELAAAVTATPAAPAATATPVAPAATATPLPSPTAAATSTPLASPTTAAPAVSPTVAATTPAASPTTAAAATPMATLPATTTPAAAVTPSGTGTPAAAPPIVAATNVTQLMVSEHATLGEYLSDGEGRALYMFTQDTPNTSNCSGTCAQNWPPAMASTAPTAGTGLDEDMVGTITRPDGGSQVTYNDMPLYYFARDMAPGDTNGQGVGGNWWLVAPDGTLIQTTGTGGTTPAAATPAASPTP